MRIVLIFMLGFVLAFSILVSFPLKAQDGPKIVGDNGFLSGVEIVTEKGETICVGPYYDKKEKTLTCKY